MTCDKKSYCWLLGLSLLANVLLIGFVVGNMSHMPRHGDRMAEMSKIDLPEEKKAALMDAFSEFRQDGKERWELMRAKRKEIVDVLTAPEFDEATFKAKSKELGMMYKEGRVRMVDKVAEIAKTMSQDERKELAKFMRSPPPKGERFGPDKK